MNRRQKIIVSVAGIFVILLALLGLTYAYFLTRIHGNTNDKSVDITTADLELTYGDGNGLIKKENIQPGDVIGEKTFTVTNTGSITIENYGVYLEEVINTFSIKEDVTYTLTCESSVTDKTCSGVEKTIFPSLNERIITNSIDKDETQTYKIKVEYAETGSDQSVDMNKRLEARVQIYNERDVVYLEGSITGHSDGDYVQVESVPKKSQIVDGKYRVVGLKPDNHTLKVLGSDSTVKGTKSFSVVKGKEESISGDTVTINDDTDYIVMNIDSISTTLGTDIKEVSEKTLFKKGTLAHAIYTSAEREVNGTVLNLNSTNEFTGKSLEDERLLNKAEDDYGTSYYYRGSVTDNYVKFAGFTWRIVRINGDGSVRLILDGLLKTVTYNGSLLPSSIAKYTSFSDAHSNAHVGYMYGTPKSSTYAMEHEFVGDKTKYDPNTYKTFSPGDKGYHSQAKVNVDKFYFNYLIDYGEYMADTLFCGDKTLYSGTGIGKSNTYYKAYERLYLNSTSKPTLKCAENAEDDYSRYSVNVQTLKNGKTTNGDLTYPIALLSADELVMAGAYKTVTNTDYYLYDESMEKYFWWTMTPYSGSDIENNSADEFGSNNGISSLRSNSAAGANHVRPVINIRSDILINSSEDGTKDNPYTLTLPN